MKKKVKKSLVAWLKDNVGPEGNLPVYEVEKNRIQPEKLHELAKHFGLEGETESDGNVNLIRNGKQAIVMYNNSGGFWYGDFSKLHHPEYKPELVPEKEAVKIATSYLKEKGWWPEGATVAGIHRGQFERAEGKKREKREVSPNHLCVDFQLTINKINAYGPGAKVKVYLGHKGEVIGVFHSARKFHKYAEFPTLPGKDLEHILKYKLRFPLEKTEVRDVKLVHFAESPVLESRFVQPVYIFTLATPVKSKRGKKNTMLEFEMHPLPATKFAPIVTIDDNRSRIEIPHGKALTLSCKIWGGMRPFKVSWDSDFDGHLGEGTMLEAEKLSVAHRGGQITSHTIKVTVTDSRGNQDSHQVAVVVKPGKGERLTATPPRAPEKPVVPDDPYVGVEWCNLYHGSAPEISGTDPSAQGFKDHINGLSGWSSRFDWGNDNAWEQDFKTSGAPGGGTDHYWADNVHFAFFAGHGSSGAFYFGSTVDDHQMTAQDARWGDGILNWIALHACQTMRANFEWDVWCDSFKGLHQMFGFHTNTEGSTPPLGARFAFWMSFRIFLFMDAFDMQTAWKIACCECFGSDREYAVIYAGQSGTDTFNDHLPGYGHVSADPASPYYWVYYKGTC